MTWSFPQKTRVPCKRNALVAVLCQLRFHPVLKFEAALPNFQDKVRHRFPTFRAVTTSELKLVAPNAVQIADAKEFHFATADGSTTIFAKPDSLALETRAHSTIEVFTSDLVLALKAAQDALGALAPTRLGLRYINLVRLPAVRTDLGKPVQWGDLIQAAYLQPPHTDMVNTRFVTQVTSPLTTGAINLGYGLVDEGTAAEPAFRIDIDRYVEAGIKLDGIGDALAGFADDCFGIFWTFVAPTLAEWMGPEEAA